MNFIALGISANSVHSNSFHCRAYFLHIQIGEKREINVLKSKCIAPEKCKQTTKMPIYYSTKNHQNSFFFFIFRALFQLFTLGKSWRNR